MKSMTFEQVRHNGLAALRRELGVVGMVRFLQSFERGQGDYSLERRKLLAGKSLGDIVGEIVRSRKNR